MPQTRTVKVGVSLSDNPNSKLEIRVKPWAVVTHEGDTVEWKAKGINGQAVRVTKMEIHRQTEAGAWPFGSTPKYKGKKLKSGGRLPLGGKLKEGSRIPYTIVITFKDVQRKLRTASIDPDMIIPD